MLKCKCRAYAAKVATNGSGATSHEERLKITSKTNLHAIYVPNYSCDETTGTIVKIDFICKGRKKVVSNCKCDA